MDFWQAVLVGIKMLQVVAQLRAMGRSGQIRTLLKVEYPDGTEDVFPFVTIRV